MQLAEVQAVIDSARARGMEPLERYIRKRLPEARESEVQEAAEVAAEIIESVPVFLARAAQEAERRNLTVVVHPVLERAERYFLRPIDLVPEMTMGLAGLLDDAYLVLRVLQNLEKGPEPFLEWDLDYPTRFVRRLLGEEVGRELDRLSVEAMRDLVESLTHFWKGTAYEA